MILFIRHKLHHIIFWLAYFIFWTLFSTYFYHANMADAFLVTLVYFIGMAGMCYACIYVWMPRYFNTKRYGLFAILSLFTLLVSVVFITAFVVPMISRMVPSYHPSFITFGIYILIDNLFFTVIAIAVKIIRERIKNEKRSQLLEKERTENELRFLKSQMNPHFLFNAINSIYVLIKKDPEFAAHTLAQFADMLRYQLYECNSDETGIEKEIAYLDNYIELEKLRKGNSTVIEYTVDREVNNFSIAPLLIIPFVENAFKYVSSFAGKPNSINIGLKYTEGFFLS